MKFQGIPNTLRNHQNGVSRPPKTSKMRSQEVPETIEIIKKSKKWNLMKTIVFSMFLRGWDIINQQIFHSKIIKNHACNPNMVCDASNDPKYQKVIQNCLQRGTQKSSKIIKNPSWDLPGSIWVHPWPTWLQKGTQMVPKDLQMTKNNPLETQKWSKKINKIQSSDISQIDLLFLFLSVLSVCKSAGHGSPGGPAAGAKP